LTEKTEQGELETASRRGAERLWSVPFAAICIGHILAYANGSMLEPVLPLYLTSLGLAPTFIGLTVAVFSLSSFATRPFLGAWVDRWSPRGVYLLGALALGCAGFAYLIPSLLVLMVARIVHGVGWAAINTASGAIAAALTPARRRGEALGYLMLANSFGALTPAIGLWLMAGAGFPAVFLLSGCLGFSAMAVASRAVGAPAMGQADSKDDLWSRLIERSVLLPSLLNFLFQCIWPITVVFVALYARSRGIEDIWIYFVMRGAAMASSQFLARLSDRWGRAPLILASFGAALVGLLIMMSATSLPMMVIGGFFCAAGNGLVGPTLLALAVDKCPPSRRGAAVATHTAAFQMGVGGSSLLWGLVIEWRGFEGMFVGGIAVLLISLVIIGLNWESARGRPALVTT
jgi:MFS family permease